MIDFTKAEVGLAVNDPRFGNGVISSTRINPYAGEGFKVSVRFEGTTKYFTADGRYLSEQYPTLRVGHFGPIDQGEIPEKVPKPLQFDGTPKWAYVSDFDNAKAAKAQGKQLIVAGTNTNGWLAICDGMNNTESTKVIYWNFSWEIEEND